MAKKPRKRDRFYESVHYFIRYYHGKASKCENQDCPGKSKRYHWSLLKGKKYDYKRENFWQLCASCHFHYDFTEKARENMKKASVNRKKTECPRGHRYTSENTYVDGKGRNCWTCKKEWVEKNKQKMADYRYKYQESKIPDGVIKIKCVGEKQRYTIQARDERFIIMTKPFNCKKTYLYSIVDLERGVRGRDNLVFGAFDPYNTKEGAEANLKALQDGEMEVSYRHYKKLEPEEINLLTHLNLCKVEPKLGKKE